MKAKPIDYKCKIKLRTDYSENVLLVARSNLIMELSLEELRELKESIDELINIKEGLRK